MSELATNWAGRLYGTNTGNIFIGLKQEGAAVSGKVRFLDDRFGLTIFNGQGTFGDKLSLELTPIQSPEGIAVGNARVIAQLQPDGTLAGTWETVIGTAGTFRAWPHGDAFAQDTTSKGEPEQVFNRNIEIGAIRLFSKDLERLLEVVKKDFTQGRLIVTYPQRGNHVTKYAEMFLKQMSELGETRELKIAIQEPESGGINRTVNVDLLEQGNSAVRVSGTNESWVVGKAESISKALRQYQSNVITGYRKYGLNLNSVIFLAMLVFIQDIPTILNRIFFVIAILTLLYILLGIHKKAIPNTIVFLEDKQPSSFQRVWPSIVSWLIGISSSLVAAFIYQLLTSS